MRESFTTYLQGALAFIATGVVAIAVGVLIIAIHSLFN